MEKMNKIVVAKDLINLLWISRRQMTVAQCEALEVHFKTKNIRMVHLCCSVTAIDKPVIMHELTEGSEGEFIDIDELDCGGLFEYKGDVYYDRETPSLIDCLGSLEGYVIAANLPLHIIKQLLEYCPNGILRPLKASDWIDINVFAWKHHRVKKQYT